MGQDTTAARFWAKVDKRGPADCWLWRGALTTTGYGALRPHGRRSGPVAKAHRLALELSGVEVADKFVLHSCDNRACVNPAHLRVGTHQDNVADMVARRRAPAGQRNGNARLTDDLVRTIRARVAAGEPQKGVSKDLGVSESTVSRIVNRTSWNHVV